MAGALGFRHTLRHRGTGGTEKADIWRGCLPGVACPQSPASVKEKATRDPATRTLGKERSIQFPD
jgi:hypothetical protein